MSGHIDDVVSGLVTRLQNGATPQEIDAFLEHVPTEQHAQVLEQARIKSGAAPGPGAEHEGATESQTGDRTGPAAGYDEEPEQVKDKGGVA